MKSRATEKVLRADFFEEMKELEEKNIKKRLCYLCRKKYFFMVISD